MVSNIIKSSFDKLGIKTLSGFPLLGTHGSLIIASILSFVVLSSKHFIIYNEETLVVISFIAFIVFSYRMLNESIENSLNERSNAIYLELQNSVVLQENILSELYSEHQKQLFLNKFLDSVREFSSQELLSIGIDRQKALQFIFVQQISHKLKSLSNSNSLTVTQLQNTLHKGFRGSVLEEFNLSKKTLQPKLIQQAISAVNQQLKI